jgi:hypothetical protein
MLRLLKSVILIFTISLANSSSAEEFLFQEKVVHPMCIAGLIPSMAAAEADHVDSVDLDQCTKSTTPVTSQNADGISKHSINYNGSFIYNFLGNIGDYSFFDTTTESINSTVKNIVIAKYVENKQEHSLVLYDIITSGDNCNGSIVSNQITNNQFLVSQLVNPALFLSIATNKEDIRGLKDFDKSNDVCLGSMTQAYNIENKELTLHSSELDKKLYVSHLENKKQNCFNEQIESLDSDHMDSQQTYDLAKKIISECS